MAGPSYAAQWVDIANRALLRIGSEQIAALDDGTSAANYCTTLLPQAVETVYTAYPWRIAAKRVQLAPLATTPGYGYSYQHALPADYASLRNVECDGRYAISDNKILSDSVDVFISYLPLPDTSTGIAPVIRDLIVRQLAYLISLPMLSNEGTSNRLLQEYNQAYAMAVTKEPIGQYRDDAEHPWYDQNR